MNKQFKALPPTLPNFIFFEQPAHPRQDGFKSQNGYDIANFTEAEAHEYAALMADAFIKHWRARVASRKTPQP